MWTMCENLKKIHELVFELSCSQTNGQTDGRNANDYITSTEGGVKYIPAS